ncbi:Tn3 family transposase, partial [Vibrio chagasii]|nr:Tn3 family transposase [Vibrio chagasii]
MLKFLRGIFVLCHSLTLYWSIRARSILFALTLSGDFPLPHRTILTERQRQDLLELPKDEPTLLQYYILSDEDILRVNEKRKAANKLGYALQLCAFRYPGRLLQKKELIPQETLRFIAQQLGLDQNTLVEYGFRAETRYEHSSSLQRSYGFRPFQDSDEKSFIKWLTETAIETRSNAELAELFVKQCRKYKIILPGITVIERLCADARVAGERTIVAQITERLDGKMQKSLHGLLKNTVDGRLTIYGWLKRFEAGHNSADANRLLDKLECLKKLNIPKSILRGIPPHRVIWLRQQGESYYSDGLRDINESRRLAILATCAIEWQAMITDAILTTHDRIVGKTYNECKRYLDDQITQQKSVANKPLKSFATLGKQLLKGHAKNLAVPEVITDANELHSLILTATELSQRLSNDPLEYVLRGHGRFRRYTQRLLEDIAFEGNEVTKPLLGAITLLKKLNQTHTSIQANVILPTEFANAKWRKRLGQSPERKLWETAVLFAIRDHLRSRDLWVSDSGTYQDTRQQLLSLEIAKHTLSLPIPLDPQTWIKSRQDLLAQQIKQVSQMIRQNSLPNSGIENGKIRVNRLDRQIPEGMDKFSIELYKQLPDVSITEILREVNEDIGLTDSFTHIHSGSPCADEIGLLNVLLAGGINMGLKKMASCNSSSISPWSLMRISNWHVINWRRCRLSGLRPKTKRLNLLGCLTWIVYPIGHA